MSTERGRPTDTADQGHSADGYKERPEREISTVRPGGSEERDHDFDGTEQVGAGAPTDPKPPYAIMIVGTIVALVLLGLLVALLLAR